MPQPPGDAPRLTARQASIILFLILAAGLILRVFAFLALPGPHHPDETFQLFEPAHRYAFGYGVVTWEFHQGLRSPVTPAVLAAILALAEPLFGGPEGYLVAARTVLALSSLIAVAAVFRFGLRQSAAHAVVAAFVTATWFEIVYFAGRPLTEALAATVTITALALGDGGRPGPRRALAIGFCLGLALMLRVHLAPGLLVAALFVARGDRRAWRNLMLGGLVPVAIFGAADWIVWGAPFRTAWNAFAVNVIEDRASTFGVEPATHYATFLAFALWPGVVAALLALWLYRPKAMWLAVGLTILASHSLIPHKEYRFVFPATALLVVAAALASADLLARLRQRWGFAWPNGIAAACALWLAASAALALAPGFRAEWPDSANVAASRWLARAPGVCGVLLKEPWYLSGAYVHMHRNVPLYGSIMSAREQEEIRSAHNVIVARSAETVPEGYARRHCVASRGSRGELCVFMREGGCAPQPAMQLNEMLLREQR